MLQINTGKLFTRGIGRTNFLRGVLYANVRLPWERDIVTHAGTLRFTDGGRGNQAIVYELEERIEKSEHGPGVLVSHTISPFLQDFSALASFGLNVIVSPDPDLTRRLTSGQAGLSSYQSPRNFIQRCFDEQIWIKDEEANDFTGFVEQLLALDRRTFLGAMRAIRTFVSGLHRISDDLGLAYTLMVSAVESLAQDFDGYSSVWGDVDERKRVPIDKALNRTSASTSNKIRDAILSVEHTSLSRRYREFVLKHIDSSYFREVENRSSRPIARCELVEALRQAYSLRSRYVHNLQDLPDELTNPFGHWETTYIKRQPTLTFQGLARLTRHVIRSFVFAGPTVAHEPYNYVSEQSGVVSMQMAPQYWVGKPLKAAQGARSRLEGFLEQLELVLRQEKDAALTDLRPMLSDVESLMGRASKSHRPALISLHALFNGLVGPAHRSEGYENFVKRYEAEFEAPSGEILIARTIFDSTEDWSIEDHQGAHDSYLKQRSKPSGLQAPRLFDAAISLSLAERYRKAGNIEFARELIGVAVENHPGQIELLDLERNFTKDTVLNWNTILLPLLAAQENPERKRKKKTQRDNVSKESKKKIGEKL